MQWGRGGWCLSQDTPPASPQSLALSRGVLHSWCPWVSPPPKAWSQRVSIRVQSDQAASGTSHPLSNSECEILCLCPGLRTLGKVSQARGVPAGAHTALAKPHPEHKCTSQTPMAASGLPSLLASERKTNTLIRL